MIRMEAKQAKQFSRWMDATESVMVSTGLEQMIAECKLDVYGQTNLQEKFLSGTTAEQMAEILK